MTASGNNRFLFWGLLFSAARFDGDDVLRVSYVRAGAFLVPLNNLRGRDLWDHEAKGVPQGLHDAVPQGSISTLLS